jgi:hypothetical protein
MITTIVVTLLLLIGHGSIRTSHHVMEQKITIRTWLGTFLAFWAGIIYGFYLHAANAIRSKKSLEERYLTISQQKELMTEVFNEVFKEEDKN